MEPKIIKTDLAEYKKADFDGVNRSGFTVFGDRVLILPDTASDMTTGGVQLPDEMVGRMSMAAETGVVVEVGVDAFTWNASGSALTGRVPKVGDRVFIERYAGQLLKGKDGKKYRVLEGRSIGAIQTED